MKTITLAISFIFLLTACGKDDFKIRKAEYLIGENWLQCSQVSVQPCGLTLICGTDLYYCINDVQTR